MIPATRGAVTCCRIIRRAIRHGWLRARAAFFHRLVPDLVVAEMGAAYPELSAAQVKVMDILAREEERFFGTIPKTAWPSWRANWRR